MGYKQNLVPLFLPAFLAVARAQPQREPSGYVQHVITPASVLEITRFNPLLPQPGDAELKSLQLVVHGVVEGNLCGGSGDFVLIAKPQKGLATERNFLLGLGLLQQGRSWEGKVCTTQSEPLAFRAVIEVPGDDAAISKYTLRWNIAASDLRRNEERGEPVWTYARAADGSWREEQGQMYFRSEFRAGFAKPQVDVAFYLEAPIPVTGVRSAQISEERIIGVDKGGFAQLALDLDASFSDCERTPRAAIPYSDRRRHGMWAHGVAHLMTVREPGIRYASFNSVTDTKSQSLPLVFRCAAAVPGLLTAFPTVTSMLGSVGTTQGDITTYGVSFADSAGTPRELVRAALNKTTWRWTVAPVAK